MAIHQTNDAPPTPFGDLDRHGAATCDTNRAVVARPWDRRRRPDGS
jgi:hypothetical protein